MAMTQSKIRAIGYDSRSIQDDTIVTDSFFSGVGPFLLIANRPIPKNSKVYMEFTVTTPYPTNKDIRHLPLCLGVHKEPSFGVLGSDCSLGAIYYTKNSYLLGPSTAEYLAYCVRDKYAGQLMTYRYMNPTSGRVPIRGTVVGLGVDMINNLISIYTDGTLFYSFSPSSFHINDDDIGDFYLAAYCAEPGEILAGEINFGRYRCKHTPEGYFDVYEELYDKIEVAKDIECQIKVGARYPYSKAEDLIKNGRFSATNEIAPVKNHRRDIRLMPNREGLEYYKDDELTVLNQHAFSFYYSEEKLANPDMAYIEYPFDHQKRLYFEFHVAGATLVDDYLGIPMTIGLTKDPNDLSKDSFQIKLYHLRTDGYHLITVKDGFEFLAGNYDIRNPSAPSQPNTIGVIVDLKENAVELYTEGTLFSIIRPNTDLVDFSKYEDLVYFFFKSEPEVFTGEGHCICNFNTQAPSEIGSGEDDESLEGYLDDDLKWPILADNSFVMDLFYYYNYTIRDAFYKDLSCTAKIISDHIPYSKYIFSTITVRDDAKDKIMGPGLNTLYNTYNTVSNTEEKRNQPTKSIWDIRKLMEEDAKENQR